MPTYQLPKFLLLVFCLVTSVSSFAQDVLPKNALQFAAGYSRHGSGDLGGFVFGTEYIRYKTRTFSLNYNFRAGINFGKDEIMVHNNTTGTTKDQSIRYTTAGVQAGVNGQLSFVRTKRTEMLVSLGAFGRFQSASNGSDGYSLYMPSATGIPSVLVEYDNRTPQNTVAFGGIFQLQYKYHFNNKYFLGIGPGFQTDTNGDAILQGVAMVGRRF